MGGIMTTLVRSCATVTILGVLLSVVGTANGIEFTTGLLHYPGEDNEIMCCVASKISPSC